LDQQNVQCNEIYVLWLLWSALAQALSLLGKPLTRLASIIITFFQISLGQHAQYAAAALEENVSRV